MRNGGGGGYGGGGGGYGGGCGRGGGGGGGNPGSRLGKVKWDNYNLVPFEKHFYNPHPNLINRDPREIEQYR